jgi:uncharacterized BrkB/YihY/UPF0761 family membrane protein
MRLFLIPLLAIIFLGWIIYHWLVKKDIKKHKDDIIGGCLFFAAWIIIYIWILI